MILIKISYFESLTWASEEKFDGEKKVPALIPYVPAQTLSFENDLPLEIQKHFIRSASEDVLYSLRLTSKKIYKLIEQFFQETEIDQPILSNFFTATNLEFDAFPNKWAHYHLRYKLFDELVEIIKNLESFMVNSFINQNFLDEMGQNLHNYGTQIKIELHNKNSQWLDFAGFLHDKELYFVEKVIRYLLMYNNLQFLTENNNNDIENHSQNFIHKIKNFFVDILQKTNTFSAKKVKINQYIFLCCKRLNQSLDSDIINYMNIIHYVSKLDIYYQKSPNLLDYLIFLMTGNHLNFLDNNQDQFIKFYHNNKLSFVPLVRIAVFLTIKNIKLSSKYFKDIDLDQIASNQFDDPMVLKNCGCTALIQEKFIKYPDTNFHNQKSRFFFKKQPI